MGEDRAERAGLIYGLADDDAHVFKQPGNPSVPGPGRGWVFVRAVYEFRSDELYVRAKVLEANGRIAWTQPVWKGR